MKTKKELNEIKEEVEKLDTKLHELTEEELEQVTGGGKAHAGIVHDNLEICAAKDTCFCLDVNKDTVMK